MTVPDTAPRKDLSVFFLGILLIFLGVALFLDRLDVLSFRSGTFVWTVVAVFGAVLIGLAFVRRNRRSLFWGSLLLFFGGCIALYYWHVLPRSDFYILPLFSIALGLSFVTHFLYNPRNVVVLVPAVVFIGFGVIFYLWWCEYVDWYDFRRFARMYWPVLLIALGLAIAFQRRTK